MNTHTANPTYEIYVDYRNSTEHIILQDNGKLAITLYANRELAKTLEAWGDSGQLYRNDTGIYWTTGDAQKATYVKLKWG